MRFLRRNIETLFIILGYNCNMGCKYCLQHPIINHQVTNRINPDIIDFIWECADLNSEDQPLQIHFFGGEPLIHYNNIREITDQCKNASNVQFSMVTNGKAITEEMVQYFNENNFSMLISWDGPNSQYTRGYDIMKNADIKNKLLKLNNFGLSGVCSAYNYPQHFIDACKVIDEEYQRIHNYSIFMNIDQIFDTGIKDRTMFDFDYDKVFNQIENLVHTFIFGNANEMHHLERNYASQLVNFVKFGAKEENEADILHSISNCRNGYSVINMDLEGNLYPCHNSQTKVGSIYSDMVHYLDKVISCDNTKDNYRSMCNNCPVYLVCNGGCNLVTPEVRKETYCKLKISTFYPVIKTILALNDSDKKVEGN